MKKIALFGGTFNPVHNGHINLLKSIDEKFGFDEILLTPSHIPPHKDAKDLASGKSRMKMLSFAFEDIEKCGVCDIELNKKGKSYTIDTVKKLKQIFPQDELYFIIGSDMLFTFDKWKNWREILKYTNILASLRNDGETEALIKKAEELDKNRIKVVVTEPFSVSSTEVRDMIKSGKDVSHLVPEKVLRYINLEGLYR